jgi:hypothetical protein
LCTFWIENGSNFIISIRNVLVWYRNHCIWHSFGYYKKTCICKQKCKLKISKCPSIVSSDDLSPIEEFFQFKIALNHKTKDLKVRDNAEYVR